MKRILFLLLFLNTSTLPEPITGTLTAARIFFSSPAGAAIGSSIIRSLGAITTFIAGWFVDKKMQPSDKKEIASNQPAAKEQLSIHHEFVLPEPITIKQEHKEVKQPNTIEKQEETCCSDCAQETTTECCAKKKSKNVTSQASEGSIQKQSAPHDQPPEDDPCPPLKERREMVKNWAKENRFKYIPKAPFYSHTEDVYKKGNRYVTTDRDCHGGGIMKMFEGTKSCVKRVATYNRYFKIFKV